MGGSSSIVSLLTHIARIGWRPTRDAGIPHLPRDNQMLLFPAPVESSKAYLRCICVLQELWAGGLSALHTAQHPLYYEVALKFRGTKAVPPFQPAGLYKHLLSSGGESAPSALLDSADGDADHLVVEGERRADGDEIIGPQVVTDDSGALEAEELERANPPGGSRGPIAAAGRQ